MKMNFKIIVVLALVLSFLVLPLSSAAHYIVGEVEDALDGTLANERKVVLWNPENSIEDNVTDVIGPEGNSGEDNIYMIDCELLDNSCQVGDVLRVKVTGDRYISNYTSVEVTGFGYDVAPNLTLNSPPIVSDVVVDDSMPYPENEIDLTPASTTNVQCNATVTDYDGVSNIENVRSEFFHESSFYGDVNNNSQHYTNSSCFIDLDYGSNIEAKIECGFDIYYYSKPGNWECFIEVEDKLGISSNGSAQTNVNELLAIGVDSPLSFGEFDVEKVTDEAVLDVTNYGNMKINLSLQGYAREIGDGYAMNCSNNENISINYKKFNLTSPNPGELSLNEFENLYENLTSETNIKEFNLKYRQNEEVNDAIKPTYWRIYVPSGVTGSCEGNIVFGAVTS